MAGADESTTVAMAVIPTRTRRGRRDLRMAQPRSTRDGLGPRFLGPSFYPTFNLATLPG